MAIPVIMPRQGQSVETCIITKWFRQKGEAVKTGDLLFSYETDKAAFDVESPVDGTILEIYYGDGAEVPVLVNVAFIGNAGEIVDPIIAPVIAESGNSEKIRESPETGKSAEPETKSETAEEPDDLKIRISPRAKRYADKNSLNYYAIHGSGPNGRILYIDIEKALSPARIKEKETQEPTGEYTEQPLTNVRKLIAKTMLASLQNSAQLTHHMSADVRKILETRRRIKE